MAAQRFNVFSRVLETEALAAARAGPPAGRRPGHAGAGRVPFVAKNLFDLRGHPTLAGAAPRQADAPAARDAAVLRALLDAGAVPIGLTHMDEYACGATGECDRRRGAQSLGSIEDHGRLIGGHGRRDRGRRGSAGPGLRHQWLDSRAGCVLRHLGLASGHWPPVHARMFSLCGKPGRGGADGRGCRRPRPGRRCARGAEALAAGRLRLACCGPASRSMPSRKPGTRCCAWRPLRPRA